MNRPIRLYNVQSTLLAYTSSQKAYMYYTACCEWTLCCVVHYALLYAVDDVTMKVQERKMLRVS